MHCTLQCHLTFTILLQRFDGYFRYLTENKGLNVQGCSGPVLTVLALKNCLSR